MEKKILVKDGSNLAKLIREFPDCRVETLFGERDEWMVTIQVGEPVEETEVEEEREPRMVTVMRVKEGKHRVWWVSDGENTLEGGRRESRDKVLERWKGRYGPISGKLLLVGDMTPAQAGVEIEKRKARHRSAGEGTTTADGGEP